MIVVVVVVVIIIIRIVVIVIIIMMIIGSTIRNLIMSIISYAYIYIYITLAPSSYSPGKWFTVQPSRSLA